MKGTRVGRAPRLSTERQSLIAAERLRGEDWRPQAACLTEDPDLFFPPFRAGMVYDAQVALAKTVCAACPVRAECLDWAMQAREPYGVWGGLDETERAARHRSWNRRTN